MSTRYNRRGRPTDAADGTGRCDDVVCASEWPSATNGGCAPLPCNPVSSAPTFSGAGSAVVTTHDAPAVAPLAKWSRGSGLPPIPPMPGTQPLPVPPAQQTGIGAL